MALNQDPVEMLRKALKAISFSISDTVSIGTAPYKNAKQLPFIECKMLVVRREVSNIGATRYKYIGTYTALITTLNKADRWSLKNDVNGAIEDLEDDLDGTGDITFTTITEWEDIEDYDNGLFHTSMTVRLLWWDSE